MHAWKLGVNLVTDYTTATSAYVATVQSAEDPDAILEEEDVETDDEQDRIVPNPTALQGLN